MLPVGQTRKQMGPLPRILILDYVIGTEQAEINQLSPSFTLKSKQTVSNSVLSTKSPSYIMRIFPGDPAMWRSRISSGPVAAAVRAGGSRPQLGSIPSRRVLIRTSVTVGTSADAGVIKIQQIPAPGSGYVRVLLLNRPEARNAISKSLLNALRFHVDSIAAEEGNGPTRALVIGSNVNEAFCAGADLKERKEMTKDEYV